MSILPLFPVLAGATGVIGAIVGVGFLIFVHELGHYLACRLTGTRTETFSIGFGPRLFGWESLPGQPRRFTTGRRRLDPQDHAMDFRIAAIPLGGYVKMVGENPDDERTGSPDEFAEKPLLSRAFIVSAGVIMNMIAAFVLYLVAFGGHVEVPPSIVGSVEPGGAAWRAGIQPGDRILEIGGNPVRSFKDLRMESAFLEPGQPTDGLVDRGGEQIPVTLAGIYHEETGLVRTGIGPAHELQVTAGDKTIRIGPTDPVEVGGIPARGAMAAIDLITEAWSVRPDQPVEVRVPGGASLSVAFEAGKAPEETIWRIGVQPHMPVLGVVRGAAAHHFQAGDRLIHAETKDGQLDLDSVEQLARLPHLAPVAAILIERAGETKRVDVDLATPVAAHAFLRDLALKPSKGTTVAPLAAGHTSPGGASALRYPSSPAAEAGLRVGDRVLSLGGEAVDSFQAITVALKLAPKDKPIEMKVVGKDDQERTLSIQPVGLEALKPGILTLAQVAEPYQTEGLMDAAGVAFRRTVADVKDIFRLIGAFFTGRISFQQNVAGPVTIVAVSAQAAEQSILSLFLFMAYISTTLAVLNILPIPVLDGGWLMFILIEKVKGSPLKPETIGRLQWVGMMMLLVLMFFAFRNDFLNIIQ